MPRRTAFLAFLSLTLLVISSTYASPTTINPPATRFTRKKYATISGKRMAYVDVGTGDPIVFLHGNPTSSYLWRNVMPFLEGRGRLIAPDLIGMGDSDKLDNSGPGRYSFVEHSNYLFQLLEAIGVKTKVTFVLHDWGSALGFLWAYYNRFNSDAVKAIVFFESFVAPFPSYEFFPEGAEEFFRLIRSPAGEQLVLQENFFLDQVFFAPENLFLNQVFSVQGNLTKEAEAVYRKPFLEPGESRRPMLTWPRQFPVAGEPADVVELVGAYSKWLGKAKVRKLFIDVVPGALSNFSRTVVRDWPMLTTVTLQGTHFIQELVPDKLGMAIARWL